MQTNSSLLFSGFGIGISIAVIGGVIDYLLSKRKTNPQRTNHLPGCMLYVGGTLGLIGLMMLVISIILNGSIGPAIMLGAGVLGGFYAGFALLMILYLFVKRLWPDTDV